MADNNEINLQGVRVSVRAGRNDIQLALEIQTPRDQVSEAGAQGIFLRPDQDELDLTLRVVQNPQTEYNRIGGPAQAREGINVHAGTEDKPQYVPNHSVVLFNKMKWHFNSQDSFEDYAVRIGGYVHTLEVGKICFKNTLLPFYPPCTFIMSDMEPSIQIYMTMSKKDHVQILHEKLENSKVNLEIKNHSLELVSRSKPLVKNSKDQRFINIMDTDKERRELILSIPDSDSNPHSIEVGDTAFSVETSQRKMLSKNTVTLVEVCTKMKSGVGFFKCKENNRFMLKDQLLPLNGMIKCDKNKFLIPILNMGDEDVIFQSKIRIGKVYPSSQNELKAEISTLSHKPEQELSKKEKIKNLFMIYFDAILISSEDYGSSNLLQFHIILSPGSHPKRTHCRPLEPIQEQDLRVQLDEWLSNGVIEPLIFPWALALVPCKRKRTGRLHWSFNFSEVNWRTVKDSYSLSCIEMNLHKLAGVNIFNSLNPAGTFHSMSISPASRDYITFVSSFGTFRFKKMPFGLPNSPSAYCHLRTAH